MGLTAYMGINRNENFLLHQNFRKETLWQSQLHHSDAYIFLVIFSGPFASLSSFEVILLKLALKDVADVE